MFCSIWSFQDMSTSSQSQQRPTTSTSVTTRASSTFVTFSSPSGVTCPVASSASLSPSPQEPASILDPDAQTFQPQLLPPAATNKKKSKQKQNLPKFSPERAEIESLKIELGFARTKVVDLETKNNDAENTIKIYSHKLKILEENRTSSLNEKYFSPASQAPKFSSETLSTPDCSCQIRAQISRNNQNLRELEMKLSSEIQLIYRKLDSISSQSVTCSSTPMTASSSVPTPSTSFPPVSPSDQDIPDDLPPAAPLNQNDHENPAEAEPLSASDSDDSESNFNFSDVIFESSSLANLN